MNNDEVTAQIMDAWEELEAEEEGDKPEAVAPPEVDEPEDKPEAEEEADDEDKEEAEEEVEEEEGETEEDEKDKESEEVVAEAPAYDDVEIQAFLAKYGNDPEKALKGAAELQRLMGRHGEERDALAQQVEQLQAQLVQVQAFGPGGPMLSDEQQLWVENAAESASPGGFVQQALQAGEFELARAVCREWAQTSPYEAMRAGQIVDSIEHQMQEQQNQTVPVPPATTWEALATNYPELKSYENQMVQTLERLGAEHPLVQEARSTDPNQAVRGIFGIYEIAKAATFALTETKNGLKQRRRQEADDAVEAAVVTSASTSPSVGGTPRRRNFMPGLSEEDFEAAFAPPASQ